MTDAHRAGHELSYFPGEVNLRRAHVAIINKVDTADYDSIRQVRDNIARVNPRAVVIEAASPLFVSGSDEIRGRRVLVVEDGPTLTHGDMRYGAGVIAARRFGAREIVDPRPWLRGSLKETFKTYPSIGPLLPAMGYGEQQMRDLRETIDAAECDLVVVATPVDLGRILNIGKPFVPACSSPSAATPSTPRTAPTPNRRKSSPSRGVPWKKSPTWWNAVTIKSSSPTATGRRWGGSSCSRS